MRLDQKGFHAELQTKCAIKCDKTFGLNINMNINIDICFLVCFDQSTIDCCEDPRRRMNERLDRLSTWNKITIFAVLVAFLCLAYIYLIAKSNEKDDCQYASVWSWKNR